jgi:tRNA1(Val) A37 N6-methylase TrmN6
MPKPDKLPNGWVVWQDDERFKVTLDAVLLAGFPRLRAGQEIADLGAGTGAVSFLLAARGPVRVTGLDIDEGAVELFARGIADNGLTGRVSAVTGDVRKIPSLLPAGRFSLVAANPPYRKSGQGRARRGKAAAACHEEQGRLEDFIAAARYLVKYGGRFVLSHLPERLPEVLEACRAADLEPKRLRMVHGLLDRPPSCVLIEAARGGRPGLAILPPLAVYKNPGAYSEELLAIYAMFGSDGRPAALSE